MQCPTCGFPLVEHARFCYRCGAQLSVEDAPAALEAKRRPKERSRKSSPHPGTSKETPPEAEAPYFTPQQQWVFLASMSVMLAAMVFFGFYGAK